jgi:hypothetical protein
VLQHPYTVSQSRPLYAYTIPEPSASDTKEEEERRTFSAWFINFWNEAGIAGASDATGSRAVAGAGAGVDAAGAAGTVVLIGVVSDIVAL